MVLTNSPAFTGWEQYFGQQNSNGRFTPIILPNNVSALKIQTSDKLNLSTKEAVELMFSVSGMANKINALRMSEFYEINSYYGDQSTLCPLVSPPYINCLYWRDSQHSSSFPKGVWDWNTISLQRVRKRRLPAEPKWLRHTHILLCCLAALEMNS